MQSVSVSVRGLVGRESDVGDVMTLSSGQKTKASSKSDSAKETTKFDKMLESNEKKPEDTKAVDSIDIEEDKPSDETANKDQAQDINALLTQIVALTTIADQTPAGDIENASMQTPSGQQMDTLNVISTELGQNADLSAAQQAAAIVAGSSTAATETENNENGAKPTEDANSNSTGAQSVQGNFVDKLKETFMSMADDNSGAFESSLMKESEPLAVKTTDTDTDAPILNTLSFAETTANATNVSEISDKSAAVEKLANRIIDEFSNIQAGSSEIKIQLEPYELGAVTITVLRNASGITAKIKSEDREICSLISDQIQKLVLNMQEKGIELKNVDVIYGKMDENMSFAQNSSRQNSQQENQNYKTSTGDRKQDLSDISDLRDLLQGDLSTATETSRRIEYRV